MRSLSILPYLKNDEGEAEAFLSVFKERRRRRRSLLTFYERITKAKPEYSS